MSLQDVSAENENEIRRLNEDIQDELFTRIKQQLVFDDINFTGNLSSSFVKSINNDGFFTIHTNNPYSHFVEFGLPPGNEVNFDALKRWVIEKLGIHDEDDAREITFRIRQKIITKGIAPKRFMKRAIKAFIGKHSPAKLITKRNKIGKLEKILRRVNRNLRKFNRIMRGVERKNRKLLNLAKGKTNT